MAANSEAQMNSSGHGHQQPAGPRVGVIGLGSLGGQIVRRLSETGHPAAAVHDRNSTVMAAVAAEGGAVSVATPRAVGELSDVVLVAVFDESQVTEVLMGEDGLVGCARRPLHVVLLSTVSLDYIGSADKRLAGHGVTLVDCGANGANGVGVGKMVASVGASDAAFEVVEPVLKLIADPVVRTGDVGAGMAAKLVRNLTAYVMWYGAWQGARLAAAAGLDLAQVVQVIDAAEPWANGSAFLVRRALANPNATHSGAATYAHKDLAAALELARRSGLELPVLQQIEQDYDQVERPLR
jgi:3-hydroxyisobutyrate dehydrogenase-like beta-hydroxyacid dehydrogenase